ncbi:hypothetical protein AMATHDRAFT_45685 [Amanita thiersii Skay4041]|uniref:Uncharacterized protein n=1 Tax=Amanita thiersii Skay4041 TaxID=703135 RepID=A0A2A9NXD2_9AGAR|nr:hypothetical protein AMATHDRAFT_45685 [Amanita thiersii Skay4041]
MMKLFAIVVTLASLVPGIVSLTVNTPTSVVQCQPIRISWENGTPPFYLSILPGGTLGAPAIKSFDPLDGNSITWMVDLQANTAITMALKDSTGEEVYSAQVMVQAGNDASCLNVGTSPSTVADSATSTANSTDMSPLSSTSGGSASSAAAGATTRPAAAPTTQTRAAADNGTNNNSTSARTTNQAQGSNRPTGSSTTKSGATAAASPPSSGAAMRYERTGINVYYTVSRLGTYEHCFVLY